MTFKNDGYLARVNGYAKLTRERESELAARWRERRDRSARDELIRSQMRTVVTVARRYRVSSVTLDELISEGNYGLIHALDKFDPGRGTRFVTYAIYWVRAYILAHLARSRTLVSTGIHSKVLAKLKREKGRGAPHEGGDVDTRIAGRLNISVERLRSLEARLNVCDVPFSEDSEGDGAIRFDSSGATFPTGEETILSNERSRYVREALAQALDGLDVRERYIVERRLMVDDDEELSLAAIGRDLGISRERARQLEGRAKRKVKNRLGHWQLQRGSFAAA